MAEVEIEIDAIPESLLERLVDVGEIAARANVAPATVKTWRHRFADTDDPAPLPIKRLKMGPLFDWREWAEWLERQRARRRGGGAETVAAAE